MIRVLVALTVSLLLTAATPTRVAGDEVRGDVGRGARFYSDNCARCHNARPPFEHRDREWSIIIVHMRVAAGLPGSHARDIEAFLRASNNPPRSVREPPSVPTSTLSGTQLVTQYGCKGCHVIGGTGGLVGPGLDTVFKRRDESWIRTQIAYPRQHKPDSVMPEFGLTGAEIDAIMDVLRKTR